MGNGRLTNLTHHWLQAFLVVSTFSCLKRVLTSMLFLYYTASRQFKYPNWHYSLMQASASLTTDLHLSRLKAKPFQFLIFIWTKSPSTLFIQVSLGLPLLLLLNSLLFVITLIILFSSRLYICPSQRSLCVLMNLTMSLFFIS